MYPFDPGNILVYNPGVMDTLDAMLARYHNLPMPAYVLTIAQSAFAHSCKRILRHMSVSPEMQMKVADWRQKAREGTLTRDEMREAITFLRGERMAMPDAAPKRASAPKAAAKSGADLLSELDGL